MTGWEVTARSWEMDKVANRFDGSWLDFRDEVIAVLADEAGINRIRLKSEAARRTQSITGPAS